MIGPRLYLEDYATAARERLERLIAEAKGDDPLAPVTVVVPTQYAGLSLRRSLSAGQGLANVRFMVLARLAEYLGSASLAERKKSPLSTLVELAAISASADAVHADTALGPISQHPRLHLTLRATFRDLACLSPEGLRRLETLDPLRAQIVKWFRRSREQLRGHYDREELSRAAAEAVGSGTAEGALRDLGTIIFYLSSGLTPAETALARALGKVGRCAVVLGCVGEAEADAPVRALAARLGGHFAVVGGGSPHPPTPSPYTEKGGGPRQHTQASCSPSPRAERGPGGEVKHLVSASDAQEEARWIVRHILHRAEVHGLAFHRVAVLYRQRDPYASMVPAQLGLAGVPVAGPDPKPLRDSPAGKLLLLLLAAIESDFSREAVMHWLAEAPVYLGSAGEPAASGPTGRPPSGQLARWDVISRKAGVIAGVQQWQERVGRYRDELAASLAEMERRDDVPPARLNEMREAVPSAGQLLSFIENLAGPTHRPPDVLGASAPPPTLTTWRDISKWAKGLLQQYALRQDEWPSEHSASLDRVQEKLDDLAGLDGIAPPATLARFRALLDSSLDAAVGRLGLTGSGVFVAPVGAAQGMDFDRVYIVGLAEGAFPPRIPDDPMLPDSVREGLGEGETLPLRQARRTEERRLYLAALASGRECILSYPRADAAGQRGQYPSPWFMDAVARLEGRRVSSAEVTRLAGQPWLTVIESSQQALGYASTLAAADRHDHGLASLARWRAAGLPAERHFLATGGSTLGRALQLETGRGGREFTVWDGRVSDLAGKSRALSRPLRGRLSPTSLERWATCPFSYFLGHVLRLSALERPEDTMSISALDRGSLVHDILRRFVATCQERGTLPDFGQPWRPEHRALLPQIADEEFQSAQARGITGRRLLWEVAKEEMRQDLAAFLEEDSRWRAEHGARPVFVEKGFGFDDGTSLPPVKLSPEGGAVLYFRGQIDRVDANASGSKLIVTDYKSGSASYYDDMKTDPLGRGHHLQLPVYALAVRETHPQAEVIGQYWFVTARGNFELRTVNLGDVEERFTGVVATIATGIQQGLFPADPGRSGRDGPQNCRFCDFDRVCPANRDYICRRKQSDPVLALYRGLAGTETTGEGEE